MAGSLFERQQNTLQQHLVEAHRDELFLGAGSQRNPLTRDLDTKPAERSAGTSDWRRSLRRIPERVAAARDIDREDASVWERAERRRGIIGRNDRDLAFAHEELRALLLRLE